MLTCHRKGYQLTTKLFQQQIFSLKSNLNLFTCAGVRLWPVIGQMLTVNHHCSRACTTWRTSSLSSQTQLIWLGACVPCEQQVGASRTANAGDTAARIIATHLCINEASSATWGPMHSACSAFREGRPWRPQLQLNKITTVCSELSIDISSVESITLLLHTEN